MALNRDKIGETYPSYRYEVSRAKIREYASALGESDPRYFSDGDDCVAPPTFVSVFTIIQPGTAALSDPQLGAHAALVHGSQSYEFGDRPMRPGDTVVCTPKIADIRYRKSNEYLTLEVDCRFADDEQLAVRSTNTIVMLGSAPEDAEDAA